MAHMEKVPTISDIDINSKFDSVLESRFIECLRRLGGKQGLPAVRLVQDIINGKSGFVIEVDNLIYQIEPQVMVGPEHGVAVMSKPDFMIWPAGGRKSSRPIAVFCDGWAYHKDAIREDALKRSALVASGKFWVVSVTHDDVKAALDGDDKTDLESPLTALAWHDGQQAPPQLARAEAGAFVRNAVAFLLRWLGTDEEGARLAAARNWAWATYLLIPGPGRPTDQQQVADAVQTRWGTLPAWMQALASKSVPASSRVGILPTVQLYWPAAFLSASLTQDTTPGIVLLDDQSGLEDQAIHTAWRQWLRLYHWAQTIPGMTLTTASGIDAHDYEALTPKTEDDPQGGGDSHPDSSWQAALQSVVSSLRKELEVVAAARLPAPSEVGYELADDRGEVVAEAELAWGSEHNVVLLDSQTDYAPRWTANGWQVIVAINGWSTVVIAALKNHQGE
jgi:DEAD/DEAH box helicase domain-containing protein